jgi:potassium channel subfamily K, other eukaryote
MTINSHSRKVTKVSPAGRILDKDRREARIDVHKQRLKNSKKAQTIEPYVVLKYGDQKWTSHVAKGLDPTFEGERATCTFQYIPKKQIKIFVYDEDLAAGDLDDLIGEASLALPSVSSLEQEIDTVRLGGINDATFSHEFRGDINMAITRKEQEGEIVIRIKNCQHLKNVDQSDTADIAQNMTIVFQCLFLFLAYIAAGTFLFPVLEPHWTYIDGAYFSVVTLTTVGYGDLLPTTPLSKAAVVLYGMIGIAYIGAAVGILGSAIMEQMNKRMASMSKVVPKKEVVKDIVEKKNCCNCTDRFQARLRTVGMSLLLIAVNVGGGAFFLFYMEGQDFGDMVYLGFISLLTIGYGDFSPISQTGRLFAIFWIMLGTVIVANFLSIFAGFIIEDKQEKLRSEILSRKLDSNTLKNWDTDGDNTIDRYEYLTARLLQLEVCNQFEINSIMQSFEIHDHNGDGTVTISDILKAEVAE